MNEFQKSIIGSLMLAPIAGFSDSCFRRICIDHGADYTFTEMISAKAICFKDKKTAVLARIEKNEAPIAIQIFGSEPETMAKAAEMLAKGSYEGCVSTCAPAAIDINMGCPVHKIVSNGEGSALMRDPVKAAEIVAAVKEASGLPVTVKMRIGYDEQHKNAVPFALALEKAGADAVCVHGRTRERMYAPGVDYESIRRVKEAARIPVVGNGDIFTPADAVKMLETGCDALMIARGALGNPFIFEEIKALLRGEPYEKPVLAVRVETAKRHLKLMVQNYGEDRGVREARKHIGWYIKGFKGAAQVRDEINRTLSADKINILLEGLLSE